MTETTTRRRRDAKSRRADSDHVRGAAQSGSSAGERSNEGRLPLKALRPTPERGDGKSSTARRAYERRQQRLALARGEQVLPRGRFAARIPFVACIIVLLSVGLGVTLLLTTRSAEDSYVLSEARRHNQQLAEQLEALQRDVETADSAPDLAARARELGMIPAKDPARLVVAPDGAVRVVGKPEPAQGAPAPLLNTPAPQPGSPQTSAPTPGALTPAPGAPTPAPMPGAPWPAASSPAPLPVGQTPAPGAPQATVPGAPQAPVPGAPQAPAPGAPQAPGPGAPQAPAPNAPQAPAPGAPQAPGPGAPQAPAPGAAQAPAPGAPQAPAPGQPNSGVPQPNPESPQPAPSAPRATPPPANNPQVRAQGEQLVPVTLPQAAPPAQEQR